MDSMVKKKTNNHQLMNMIHLLMNILMVAYHVDNHTSVCIKQSPETVRNNRCNSKQLVQASASGAGSHSMSNQI